MLKTKYITLQDFEIVEVANHCDYTKLNISINEALSFELPEILCEYYELVKDAFEAENPTKEQTLILEGATYSCGRVTKRYLGAKDMLVYYSYANYLMNSVMNDTGLGFVKKTDQYSLPTPYKDVKEFVNKNRNMGFAIVKQLKEYLCHVPNLTTSYGLKLDCHCGCADGNCDFTEKRIYKFKPKVIKKQI